MGWKDGTNEKTRIHGMHTEGTDRLVLVMKTENGMIAKDGSNTQIVCNHEIWYREKMDESRSGWQNRHGDDKDQHNGIPTYYDENGIKKEGPPMVDGKLHGMVMGYR